jgi:DNA-binding FadR family transcriptional regulator
MNNSKEKTMDVHDDPAATSEVLHGDIEAWLEVRTGAEIRVAIKAMILAERSACVKLCKDLAEEKKKTAAKNDGRQSDMAFGQHVAADYLREAMENRTL